MALEKITAEDFTTAIKKLTTSDKSVWWKYLDSTDDGTELCLAVGWQDGYDEDADLYQQDGYTLCAKIGYKHSDTMVMDYSDFREPSDKKGNVWQTDMAVAKGPISDSDVKWYNDEAQRIWDKYGTPDKNGTTALDLMESKKNEEKIPFKSTEFPKELKQLYDACNKRLMTCDSELSSASDVSNKQGVSSATYTFKGEYGNYVKLKVTLDYEDGEFAVIIKGLDETEGYSWDVLGSGKSDTFKSAMDAALSEFDKNIVPLVQKVKNAMKRGESLKKSESAKGSMRRKQESLKKEDYSADTTEGLIQAFKAMQDAWHTIIEAADGVTIDDKYGVKDWFNDACFEYDNPDDDDGKKVGDYYQGCFVGSFDEIPMDGFCDGMIAYLNTLKEVK